MLPINLRKHRKGSSFASILECFSIECRKTNTEITKNSNYLMNQLKREGSSSNRCKARENDLHMICTSRDSLRDAGILWLVPTKREIFCSVYDAGEADLSNGNSNPKRKLGVTAHFSEITEFKFGRKILYIVHILKLF